MKKEETITEIKAPFNGFSILRGEHKIDDEQSDIEDKDPALIEDDGEKEGDPELAKRLAAGDEALKKVVEKQSKKSTKIEEEKEEEIEEEVEEDDDAPQGDAGISAFVKALSEKGIIDFDDKDEDFKGDEDSLETLIDKTVKNRINKWANNLPEDFSKMLEFIESGGTPKEFLDVYYGNHSWSSFDIDNENNQKTVIRESLKLSGESDEDINDMIDEWEVNGSLEKRAKSALSKLQKHEDAQKQELVELQKDYAKKQEQAQKQYWEDFKSSIYSREELKGFKLTEKVKNNLWEFMTIRDKRSGKTGYEQAIENDKEASLLFAYMAMNKFDINKLEKQVETKVARKYSGMLKNYSKSSREKMSGGSDNNDFGNNNPFSAFRNV